MSKSTFTTLLFIFSLFFTITVAAQSVHTAVKEENGVKVFSLSNNKVTQKVLVKNNRLVGDILSGKPDWLAAHHNAGSHAVYTDGDFSLKMMWTDWTAPGRQVHGNVQIAFNKADYRFQTYHFEGSKHGGQLLQLYFKPTLQTNTIQLRITYELLPDKFYARRQIAVRDTVKKTNWLRIFLSRNSKVSSTNAVAYSIVKKGAFGQPAAVNFTNGGVFFGIEYPAATTTIKRLDNQRVTLKCKEIVGAVVKAQWVSSKWVVEGLAPNRYVKNWFFKYLPDIRYTKNEPYALYNSWYDLRSPAFKNVADNHIMNQKNILDIIDAFKENMIKPYGIHLDAFVLDDGWDIHKSDWKLDPKTFPNGLRTISDALAKMGTALGIWYGPTGGYSFRNDRINWMKDHGYGVVRGQSNRLMLCIGDKRYSKLFQKRTTDMVKNGGVGYFKWDGLQFSCSNPTHGHPIGEYSRRALLDSLIAKCKAVRAVNPDVYLNITSGTWLSPWWMMFANQIWMQGGDYGFADVPSYSQRDASMTYKDLVLYNDFYNLDQWFPLSNLMTHGIIKGRLNEIGGKDDPLSKFTDDAMFYFGRGVTMYELYISPDLLNAGEWNALSKSLKWAEDRFPVLNNNTYMIGGQPAAGDSYGYVHYKGNKGIIALRNPQMKEQNIDVKLAPAYGMDPEAHSLVLERVYPDHWISPNLYAAGATITLPLKGYESAIYEVYPLDSAHRPLLADVSFREIRAGGNNYQIDVLETGKEAGFLNPAAVASLKVDGQEIRQPLALDLRESETGDLGTHHLNFTGNSVTATVQFGDDVLQPRFIVFLHPDSAYQGKTFPEGELVIDGKAVKSTRQQQKGVWSVYSYMLKGKASGSHTFSLELQQSDKVKQWEGHVEVWLIGQHKIEPVAVTVRTKNQVKAEPMPPSPYEKDAVGYQVKLGEGKVGF